MSESFDQNLRDAFQGRQAGRLLALTLPAPAGLWREVANRSEASFDPEPTVFWSRGDADEGIWVGRGAARICRAEGPERFLDLEKQLQELFVSIEYQSDFLESIRLFGGGAFFADEPDGRACRALGSASFVLPRITYVDSGPSARWTIVSDGSDLDAIVRFLEPLLVSRPSSPRGSEKREARIVREAEPHAAESFRALVRRAQSGIASGSFDKVVISRRVRARLGAEFDLGAVLARLMAGGPDSVRFAYRMNGGTFLGATPERLVRVRGRELEADALAGTIPKTEKDARDRLLGSVKDRREHEFVVRAIDAALRPIAAELSIGPEPEVTELPNLYHLRTSIRARLSSEHHPLALVARLHPTPAVGGAPAESALDFIRRNEVHSRGWYAGPLGWVGPSGDGEFVVALRSAFVEGTEAELYAGAGIVVGSDPEAEFAETELKLGRMLGALGVTGASKERDRRAEVRSAETHVEDYSSERT